MKFNIQTMTEADIDNLTKEEREELSKQLDEEIGTTQDYGSPTPEKKDSTLILYRELIAAKDSKKFGNLSKEELGKVTIGARHHLDSALFCDSQGLPELAQYFEDKAEIIFATSLSLKGKLIDNIVTQIRKEQKAPPTITQKKGWFGSKKVEGDES